MAICHISAKASVSRGAGRSSTASAAYRAGVCITDLRTGEVFDYRRKGGVESADLLMPGDRIEDRAKFWNDVEAHHKRGDAMVAREVVIALPDELSPAERKRLAHDFAKELVKEYGIAIDVAIHKPGKEGDERNHHGHLLMSACTVDLNGVLGKKCNELDPIHCKRNGVENLAERFRERWADLVNERLQENGIEQRIDHRTLAEQGINREPTKHLGPAVTAIIRRGGWSYVEDRMAEEVGDRLSQAKEVGDLVREKQALEKSIISLSTDIAAAKRQMEVEARPAQIEDKVAAFLARADAKNFEQKREQAAAAAAQQREREAQQRAKVEQEQRTMEEKRRAFVEAELKALREKPQPEPERPRRERSRDYGNDGPGR